VGELFDAVRALAGADLHPLPAPELLERCASLVAVRNMLDAELARTIRRAELAQAAEGDGLKGMAPWLRGHTRLSPAAAGRLVRAGRTLEALPAVAAAAAAGAVTGEQVELLAPVITPANRAAADAQNVDHAAVDTLLAGVAATRPHTKLAQVVHHYLERLNPDGPEPDPTAGRRLSIAKHADGSTTGRWELDAVGSEKVQTALESIVAANRPAGDTRSRAQQLADALVQLCDNLLASGTLPFLRTVKPHLLVTIGVADLVDPSTAPATARANFGAVLSAARTRWAACDPDITRILLDPDGLPLDMGRTVRLVPPHLRRAVEARDQACVFAGCHAPTYWCEVHHLLEWALDEGETSLENSGLLCERHHTQVHHGYRIERDAANRWHTYRPDGSEIHVLHPIEHDPPTTRAG
jgi:hypothetical protein